MTATPPKEGGRTATNLLFTVAGEHLFGGPAKGLPAEGAYMFEDAPFAPRGWEAFRFGDENRRLPPNFEKLDQVRLDGDGKAVFAAGFPKTMRPRAAVKMTVQGGVFEGGGRPAAARASTVLHAYPHYIGVALPDTLRQNATPKACRVVVVNPDGTPCRGARRLIAAFEQVETVYSLKKDDNSWEWKSDKIRHPLGEEVAVQIGANGLGTLAVPVGAGGDYAVTLREEETGVSFGASYWVGGAGDAAVRAPLQNPSRISLATDKKIYYPGERPRLTVKAPFAGVAWLQVLRDEMIYSQILTLTNATCEIELAPVKAAWAPGVDVALSVVQAVKPGERQVANRALGHLSVRCATRDSALDVAVKATVVCAPTGGSTVTAEIDAHGQNAVGERAVVTVVDEGINLLTDEKTPDPAGWFGETRLLDALLYDVYNRLLPILDGDLKRAADGRRCGRRPVLPGESGAVAPLQAAQPLAAGSRTQGRPRDGGDRAAGVRRRSARDGRGLQQARHRRRLGAGQGRAEPRDAAGRAALRGARGRVSRDDDAVEPQRQGREGRLRSARRRLGRTRPARAR